MKQDAITYEELADPKWRGKICSRSGQHTYNISLVASMIAHHGEEKAEKPGSTASRPIWRASPPAATASRCATCRPACAIIAIGNTYYMVAMQKNPDQKAWADAVKILFPNAADRGTHVNISGMATDRERAQQATTAHEADGISRLRRGAEDLRRSQRRISGRAAASRPRRRSKSWGTLKADPLPLAKIAELRKKASELVDNVHFDAGPNT